MYVNLEDVLQTLGKVHMRWRLLPIWYINIIVKRRTDTANFILHKKLDTGYRQCTKRFK